MTETTIRLATGVPGCAICGCGPGGPSFCDTIVFPTTGTLYGTYYRDPIFDVSTTLPVEITFPLTYHSEPYNRLPGPLSADSPYWPFAGYWTSGCITTVDEPTPHGGSGHFKQRTIFTLLPGGIISGADRSIGFLLLEIFAELIDDDAADTPLCADAEGMILGEETVHTSLGGWVLLQCEISYCFNGDGSPLDFSADLFTGVGQAVRIHELADPDPFAVSVTACVTVRSPSCPTLEPPIVGIPKVGIPVVLNRVGIAEVASGTTDSEGRFCAAITEAGDYEFVATDTDGCEGRVRFVVNPCQEDGATYEFEAVVCCGKACIQLLNDATDPPAPIPAATVNWGAGLGELTTDSEGKACIDLTSTQMAALGLAGTDCSVRLLSDVRISRAATATETALLERCVEVEVTCGVMDPTPVPVYAAYIPPGYQVGGCCPGKDACETVGPAGRALVPEAPDVAIQVDRRDITGTITDTFRYDGTPTLDLTAFDATGVTTYDSGCVAPTIAPVYDDGVGNLVPYLSCRVRLELCRDGGAPGRVRVRVFRAAGCSGFTSWDDPAGPDDIEWDFELPSGINKVCYELGIFESGTIPSDNDTWTVSVVPT